ncbi:Amidase [Pleurostoma richardsiae]|uniref:Amidase n=1 Tax=Pleurostoma richardsiae TaxID=41990 RepID=A0AA38S7C2_9PEZI|nr:Amidase [Pleurostoma richardsiae]
MSVFFSSDIEPQNVTLQDLRGAAARKKLTISEKDEGDYLNLLRAADAAVRHVAELPKYTPPSLLPSSVPGYKRLSTEENLLNAWSHKAVASDAAPTSGALADRTVAFKDNISVAGLPITCGTFPEFVSGNGAYPISTVNASVVSRVIEAGGTIAGTATSLLAAQAVRKWRERNKITATEGEVSEELGVDLAIGGDQGGSIRLPCAFSGIYGLKPTHGLIPYTGIASLHPLIDHCGPMANSVADIALLLSVLAGYDGLDPRMTPESPLKKQVEDYTANLQSQIDERAAAGKWNPGAAGSGLRVGLIKEAWEVPGLNPEIGKLVKDAAMRFSALGATLQEVSIPLHKEGPIIWTAATRASMAGFAFANAPPPLLSYSLPELEPPEPTQRWLDLLSHHNPAAPNVLLAGEYLNKRHPPVTTAKAMAHVLELRAAYDAALQDFDVLVLPANLTVAPKHPPEGFGVMERIQLAAGNTANTSAVWEVGGLGLDTP